jgi:hypothetical protein
MNRYLIYRISSKSFEKPRVEGVTKMDSLNNLLECFPDWKMVCIADNCEETVIENLKKRDFFHLEITSLGHHMSFFRQLNYAIHNLDDEDIVYFIEDDYLHRQGAQDALEEGLGIFDYVTLYDHPDKYGVFEGYTNPYAKWTKLSEPTRVWKGKHALWRTTNSTTLSFACKVKTIKADQVHWIGGLFKKQKAKDFYTWIRLTKPGFNYGKLKPKFIIRQFLETFLSFTGYPKRTLGVPIPSYSAHLELAYLPCNFPFD